MAVEGRLYFDDVRVPTCLPTLRLRTKPIFSFIRKNGSIAFNGHHHLELGLMLPKDKSIHHLGVLGLEQQSSSDIFALSSFVWQVIFCEFGRISSVSCSRNCLLPARHSSWRCHRELPVALGHSQPVGGSFWDHRPPHSPLIQARKVGEWGPRCLVS